jgi:hypothetical protein
LITTQPLLIIERKTLPAKNLAELIAWLNANPDKATQGTAGAGGASDVAGIFFQREKRLERPVFLGEECPIAIERPRIKEADSSVIGLEGATRDTALMRR